MSGRENIISAVKANQPEKLPLPDIQHFERNAAGSLEKFAAVLKSAGGFIYYVSSYDEMMNILLFFNDENKKIVSAFKEISTHYDHNFFVAPQTSDLHNIDVAIIKGLFGVAENGAVWITNNEMHQRVLPFICQHLAVVINAKNILPTMHEAYEAIGKTTYDFGTFIAGPSKTADIEQSLVIGAHGPRSMTVFVLNQTE